MNNSVNFRLELYLFIMIVKYILYIVYCKNVQNHNIS